MHKKYLIVILAFLIISLIARCSNETTSKVIYTHEDSVLFFQKVALANNQEIETKQKALALIARTFIGTPYVGKTLEVGDKESLVINLRELDCTTFVENCIALTNTCFSENRSFVDFQKVLEKIRYRNGILDGYTSRLHYFTDWISDNSAKGFIDDITQKIGGVQFKVQANFMSTHPEYYKQLRNDSTLIPVIAEQEKKISEKEFFFIPKENISEIESKLEEGMIVGITTNMAGLEISHTGILVKENGRIHLLHASSDYKKVMISEKPLAEYLADNKKQTGIMVLKIK